MKKSYTCYLSFCFTLIFTLSTNAQRQVFVNSEDVYISHESICTYPTTGVDLDLVVERSSEVKNRMAANRRVCPTQMNVIYNGFTSEAEAAYQFAVDIWANILDSSIPINIEANYTALAPGVLGSAFSPARFDLNNGSSTVYASALAESLRGEELFYTDSDFNFTTLDIVSNFSSNINWFFGIPGDGTSISPGETDFITVVLHEIGHGLGFFGNGRRVGSTNQGTLNQPIHIWDTFIEGFDFANNAYIDVTDVANPSELLFTLFTSGTLRTKSPLAEAANDGFGRAPTYAPATFNPGSSYSHLDTNTYAGTVNALMAHALPSNTIIHDPGQIALGFMADMGWNLCAGVLSNDDFSLEDISISPNPFTESITIELPPQITNQEFNVSIVDINGRIISSLEANTINGEITISNLSNLKNALYFLTIESKTSDISITKKIIKN